jgi:hypothetical protein
MPAAKGPANKAARAAVAGPEEAAFFKDQLDNLGHQAYWRVLGNEHPLTPVLQKLLNAADPCVYYLLQLSHTADIAHRHLLELPYPTPSPHFYMTVGSSMIWTRRAVDVLLSVYFPAIRLSPVALDRLPPTKERPAVADSIYKPLTQLHDFIRAGTESIQTFGAAEVAEVPEWIQYPVYKLSKELLDDLQTWLTDNKKEKGATVRRNFLSAFLTVSKWATVSFILSLYTRTSSHSLLF